MNDVTIAAFEDELEKIGFLDKLREGVAQVGKNPQMRHLKYPLAMAGGILGWEQMKRMKRRYDIGKMVEEQQRGR